MIKTALAMFMIGGMAAWGQEQNDGSAGANKVDRATAYYHYTLARMYVTMAGSRGRNREYLNKAIENYKAAIKADPQTPLLSEELSLIYTKGPMPLFLTPVPRLPASRQDHARP
jgi:hypothetical protein